MLTLLLYVLIVGLVAALLFLVASVLFGRSEELGPLPEGTTVTVLPAESISGSDVRALRFQQVVRGYKAGEVDWALTRLAARIDELETQLAHATAATNGMGLPADTPAPRRVSANPSASGETPPLPEVLAADSAAVPAPAAPGDPVVGSDGATPAATDWAAGSGAWGATPSGSGTPGAWGTPLGGSTAPGAPSAGPVAQ